jgi:anti-anti-sigma factor
MENGKILYAVIGSTCVLKMIGSIAYNISPSFDRFIQKISEDESAKSFVIDLTETTYIDSTNLGLLARLHAVSSDRGDDCPTMISNSRVINDVLYTIGFNGLFNIVDCQNDLLCDMKELPALKDDSADSLAKIMLKAHCELAALSKNNRELFADVITYLKDDIKSNTRLFE